MHVPSSSTKDDYMDAITRASRAPCVIWEGNSGLFASQLVGVFLELQNDDSMLGFLVTSNVFDRLMKAVLWLLSLVSASYRIL